jgi:3-methyladenine DNA glycosylase AlkC
MEPFKAVFSPGLVDLIAEHLGRHFPGFDRESFVRSITPRLDGMELMERVQLITDALHAVLPRDPAVRADMLLALLHPDPLPDLVASSNGDGLRGWAILPLTILVGQHGIGDFDRSLMLLREMTKRFSSEFAIRYFLIADQNRTLATLAAWVRDPDPHVRRLVSEGTRPRLPWAMRLQAFIKDPGPVLPLLTALRDDPEEYVRRSVANNLNDISKDHPSRVASLLRDWMVDADRNRKATLRHAARSLIKAGNAQTLAVFGYASAQLAPTRPQLASHEVRMGDALAFSLALKSLASKQQSLTIDYVLHFLKANGELSPKVFKGGKLVLNSGEIRLFQRKHQFRDVTTRRHYPGPHALSFRINGQDTEAVGFELLG